jgi:hypothetical protein
VFTISRLEKALSEKSDTNSFGGGGGGGVGLSVEDDSLFSHSGSFSPLPTLLSFRDRIFAFMHGPIQDVLTTYIDNASRTRDVSVGAVLHAHVLLLWANASQEALKMPRSLHANDVLRCGFASILTSGTFCSLWQRTARMQADFETSSEIARLRQEKQERGGGSSRQGKYSPFSPRGNKIQSAIQGSVLCNILCTAPWHEACSVFLRARRPIKLWLDKMDKLKVLAQEALLPATVTDVVLSQCLRITLQRPKLDVMCWKWCEEKAESSKTCKVVLESSHPYAHGVDYYKRLYFPGATSITISFDMQTRLESTDERGKKDKRRIARTLTHTTILIAN